MTFNEFQAQHAANQYRPRFAHKYTVPAGERKKATDRPRLLDLLITIAPDSSTDFLAVPEKGEVAVIDVVRREKAFFMLPQGTTPEQVAQLVSEFFGAPAMRLESRLWMA
jgi:hypothetical protein